MKSRFFSLDRVSRFDKESGIFKTYGQNCLKNRNHGKLSKVFFHKFRENSVKIFFKTRVYQFPVK